MASSCLHAIKSCLVWFIELWLSEKSMETVKTQILTVLTTPMCNVATPTLVRGTSPSRCTSCTLHRSWSCKWNRGLAELWGVAPLSFSILMDDQELLEWQNPSFFSGFCWDSSSWPPREWLLSPPWPLLWSTFGEGSTSLFVLLTIYKFCSYCP